VGQNSMQITRAGGSVLGANQQVTFSHSYRWSAHPWGDKGFSQETSGVSYDHENKKHFHSVKRVDFDFDQFPEALAIDLASLPSKSIKVVYR